jgi:hypothetical protein
MSLGPDGEYDVIAGRVLLKKTTLNVLGIPEPEAE